MINWITDQVALGEYSDAINEELLKNENIDCILNVRAEDEPSDAEMQLAQRLGIKYFHVAVNDYKGIECKIELKTAIYMFELLTEKFKRILVHCTAGIDRSPFVVACWLSGDDEPYEKYWVALAYADIKKKRPIIAEHYEWLK
jgi:protein-tyrosine phosphatase